MISSIWVASGSRTSASTKISVIAALKASASGRFTNSRTAETTRIATMAARPIWMTRADASRVSETEEVGSGIGPPGVQTALVEDGNHLQELPAIRRDAPGYDRLGRRDRTGAVRQFDHAVMQAEGVVLLRAVIGIAGRCGRAGDHGQNRAKHDMSDRCLHDLVSYSMPGPPSTDVHGAAATLAPDASDRQ